jgi:4-diphosphocytidyl-2-C-methyl-D-erythritol kinase
LRVLWRLDPARDGGDAVAVALGADVPVCLRCRTSRVRGVGDEIVEVPDLPAAAIVLANPGVALPTAAVFRRHAAAGRQAARHPAADDGWHGIADAAAMARRLGATTNDLEAAATALAPEIGAVIAALRAAPDSLLARMSGSGATCFALFASDAAARSAARALQAAYRGWWVEATRLRTAPPPTERL